MSSKRGHFKDRILEGIAKAIKEVHAFSCGDDGETITITNDDRSLQKLVERLDHAFLHGLKNVTRGYWGVAKLFAHRNDIEEITKLDRLTTDLGRSRAWLYKSLNDTSLESYLRCFQENPNTMRKYYVETGILRDKQRLMVLQTLISGLDFITFGLELNIAYFDLVSYIPRSSSVSEPEDDATPLSNDSVPTTPSTPATIPDSEYTSSIASSEPFSPVDNSPQFGGVDITVKNRFKIEKRHSFPQHYSEIDKSDPPLVETLASKQNEQENKLENTFFSRSFSAGKIIEGKATRPSSLGVPSRNERFPNMDGSLKLVQESFEDDSLEVIRVKPKRSKKGHKKKKKGERSLLNGDGPSRNASSGTLSSMCEDAEAHSPRLDAPPAGDAVSKSSSFSSLQSFSDRGSINETSVLGRSDADSTTGITFIAKVEDNAEETVQTEKCAIDLQKLIKDIDDKTATLQLEKHKLRQSCESGLSVVHDKSLAQGEPDKVLPGNVQTHQTFPKRASLNFDETVTFTLSTPPSTESIPLEDSLTKESQSEIPKTESPPIQSLSDDFSSSLTSVPSEAAPSFAVLFEKSPQVSWSPLEQTVELSPSSSSYSASDISGNPSDEGLNDGSYSRGTRTSSDASWSFKESSEVDGSATDVNTVTGADVAVLDTDCKAHEAEIEVDNNLKLYLMLEIFKKEQEQFKKLLRMSTGHTEGNLQPAFILLTDHSLYILRRGDCQGHYSTQHRLPYTTLDYISVGLNYQTVHIVCTNRRKQYWLTTGDEELTRFFLSCLQMATRESEQLKEPISILTDATTQRITLRKWAAQESKTEVHDIKMHLYSLVHWENLTDLSMTPDLQLYEPQVTKKGSLFYKVPGNFIMRNTWNKAWFVLRNEMFCQFNHRQDKQPVLSVQLRTPFFGGCRRVRNGERPHSFELILSDGASLELSSDSEQGVSNWLQAICQVVAQTQMAATSPTHSPPPCQPCCSVTTSHKLLICHEDSQTNFYRPLAAVDITDISGLIYDPRDASYVVIEFTSEPPKNPWVFYFNSASEKTKFESNMGNSWKEHLKVDLPLMAIDDARLQKRCHECSTLIQSSWQRSDSLMRGRVGGNIW